VNAGAEQFVIRLLPQDRAQVGAFNDKVEFSGSFTADRDELVAALRELDSATRRASTTPSISRWTS